MPIGLKIAAGTILAVSLIGLAGFHAFSSKLGPLVQEHGTTYYNDDGPAPAPVICKPEAVILAAIKQVHAKFDYLAGGDLKAFEERARDLRGLPPLDADELYVITEDDKLRNGEMVLFIGLKTKCVSAVFGFPANLYRQIRGKTQNS
ncbi:MAG: hypothetical protein WA441_07290 [Methyloceanibacter sp.]